MLLKGLAYMLHDTRALHKSQVSGTRSTVPMSQQPPKLLDQVRTACRRLQYSYHTETAYVRWAKPRLTHQIKARKLLHNADLDAGYGTVHLPHALARTYPNAESSWIWQFVFPSRNRSTDPRTGTVRRHHRSDSAVQRAVKNAVAQAGLSKRVSCHTLRHSFTMLRFVNLLAVGLLRISLKTDTTSARHKSMCMCSTKAGAALRIRWMRWRIRMHPPAPPSPGAATV